MLRKAFNSLLVLFAGCVATGAQAIEFTTSGFLNTAGAIVHSGDVRVLRIQPGQDGVNTASPAQALAELEYTEVRPKWNGLDHFPEFGRETSLGLQMDGDVNDKLSATVQIVANGTDGYKGRLSWMFGKYLINDNWTLRVGRVRVPTFMLSEYLQVGYVHPWVRPPQHVYTMVPGSFSNTTGADLYFTGEYQGYDVSIGFITGGGTDSEFSLAPGTESQIVLENQKMIAFSFGNFDWSVKAAYSAMKFSVNNLPSAILAYNAALGRNPDYTQLLSGDRCFTSFGSIGFQYDANNILVLAEYARRVIDCWLPSRTGAYITGGYRFGNFLPTVTLAKSRTQDKHILDGLTADTFGDRLPLIGIVKDTLIRNLHSDEDSIGVDVKWTPIANVALKASWYNVKPINGTTGLFDYHPLRSVNIYSIGANMVF